MVTIWDVKTVSVNGIYSEEKTPTFQFNRTVVSKLIQLKLDLVLGHASFKMRVLDCQCSTGVSSNVTIRNQSVSENNDTAK